MEEPTLNPTPHDEMNTPTESTPEATPPPVTLTPSVTRCEACHMPIEDDHRPRVDGRPKLCGPCQMEQPHTEPAAKPKHSPLHWREFQRGMDQHENAPQIAEKTAAASTSRPEPIDKPEHYPEIDPWKLQEQMQSTGDVFLDGRRCDAVKYSFRSKGGTLADYRRDLVKAGNAITAAIARIDYLTSREPK